MDRFEANSSTALVSLQTNNMFDNTYVESDDPPIDTFRTKLRDLVTLIDPTNFSQLNANLVVLGSVSAVESYLREVIRKCINIDQISRNNCELLSITYAAAISHSSKMMPEAILENYTFSNKDNIIDAIKNILSIKGHRDKNLDEILIEYDKVCNVRHCLVHRYGKLGAKNASILGLNFHQHLIEKPILLDYIKLQSIQSICISLVEEMNNFLFRKIMHRLICDIQNKKLNINEVVWHWHYGQDRKLFLKYYNLFVSNISPSPYYNSPKELYDYYKNYYHGLG